MSAEKQKTILLVEDEAITALTEKLILEKYGYKVITVHSGEEAVATVEKTPAIDLILMDINLGAGIDGTEAAALILKNHDLPVVFLSSHTEPEVVAKTEKITSYGYVVKNSSITVLDASIKMAFKLFEAKVKEKEKESQMEAALETLRESEQRLNFHVNNSPLATIEWTSDFIVTRWSAEAEKIFGWKQSETIGKPIMDLQLIYDEDIPIVQKTMERLSGGSSKHVISTNRNYTKEGKVIVCEWYNSVLLNPQGKMISVMSQVMDITERKRASAAQRESELRLKAQYQSLPVPTFTWQIKGKDFELIGFNDAAKVITHEKTIGFVGRKASELYANRQEILRDLQQCIVERKIIKRETLSEHFVPGKFIALTIVPIPPDLVMVHMEDVTERKQIENALRESEEKYRLLADHMTDTIWLMDLNFKFVYISPSVEKLRGYTLAEIQQFPLDRILTPASLKPALEVFAVEMPKVLADPSYSPILTMDLEFYSRDGKTLAVESKLSILRDENGNPTNILGQDRDITERKRSEAALQKSELQLKAMLDSSPVVVLLIQEGKLIYLNPAAEKITGWKEEEFIGKSFTGFVHKDDIEVVIKNNRERMGGNSFLAPYIIRINKKTGGFIYAEVNGTVINLDGKPTMLGFLTDITERKQAESQREAALLELLEAKALIDAVIENVPLMIFLKEAADLRFVIFNRAGEELLGYDRRALLGKNNLDLFPPEQAAQFMAKDREVLDGEAGMLDIPEEPILTARKGQRLLHTRKVCIRSADGITKYLLGISEDITERKQAEEAVRISEAKQSNALQMTKAGHWEYDVDHDVFTFNDNFYRIFRTTAAAVGGYQMSSENYARKFCHPDDMAMVGDETRKAIESADPNYSRQVEHRIIYADGQVGTIIVRFFIIKDPQGRTIKTYGVNQDISERKWAEEEIRRQLAEKEILLKEVHHRIKNNIASIGGLLSLHMQSVTNPEAIAVLQDAIGRVNSMEILYEKLLLSESYKEISVENYLADLIDTIITMFPDKAKITVDKRIADFPLDPKRLFPLGIIINELLTNKMKYAFSKRKTGLIKISLTNVDKHVTLVIQDNGNRLPAGFDIDQSKGFGLMLVKMLSQQLGGSFTMEKDAGTRCKLEFNI
jgi:PAS domain S-box-containing protein